MTNTFLATLEPALALLAEARTIQQIHQVVSMASAAEQYAKESNLSIEAYNYAAEIKLRAVRKLGESLKVTPKNEGAKGQGRPSLGNTETVLPKTDTHTPKLADMGITLKQSARAQKVADVPLAAFEQHIEDKKSTGVPLTDTALLKRYHNTQQAEQREARANEPGPALPDTRYDCLVIDPPWDIEKIQREERPNQIDMDYPTMTLDELRGLPVSTLACDDAHLYLWTTHKHLPDALMLAAHWGFRYQCLLTWVKNVGFTPFSWMYSTEHVLFCRRGSLPLTVLGRRLDFQAKVQEHSRKPDEFYQLVADVSPGRRLELFARQRRGGFDAWGNEVDRFAAVGDDVLA